MSDARDFYVKDSSGADLLGAAGTFTAIARSVAGATRTPPTIVELGEGAYRVVPTDADEAAGTVVHIDCGAGRMPRRHTFACYKADRSNQFWAFHVENPDGTVWTGTAPTVGSYRSSVGIRTPPALVPVEAAYLFVAVPTGADITADVEIKVLGPAGSAQPAWLGGTEPISSGGSVSWLPGVLTPVPEASAAVLFGREAYLRQLKALLPRGSLFNLESDAVLSRTLEGVADELTRVNARGVDLINETDPRTATETLAEWETTVGLPDDLVPVIPGTTAERRVAITQKYVSRAGQNYTFFAALCAACGYPLVSIDLFATLLLRANFRANDRVYDQTYAYTMRLNVAAPTAGALAHADFERVIRHATHAHIQVMFTYA